MNYDNLEKIINRYEENYYMVNDSEHDEKFKWSATRCFRDAWFSDNQGKPFSHLFAEATKGSSVLINNSMISPTTGIVKMAEQRPIEVETLFRDVLFAPFAKPEEIQDHMDSFLDGIEKIRLELFPQFYRYKQDRHAASCYLAFFAPSDHFIYRYSEAEEFAQYIEFGKDLGAGESFSLANYYEMAGIVVKALASHTTLMEKYKALIGDDPHYYNDESLHLMAFDLMYCARCYNFYNGLTHAKKKDSIKAFTAQQLMQKEAEERQKRIDELDNQIHTLDLAIEPYAEISLLGVKVHQAKYGDGTIIKQDINRVTVRFAAQEVAYIIDKKYPMRPRFENDEEAVEAFTKYAELVVMRERLVKEQMALA